MPKTGSKLAFIFPGQGAVPDTPLTDFQNTSIATIYTDIADPIAPELQDFYQSAIQSDESAQLGVFGLTLAMASKALKYCQPDIVTGYSSGLYAAMVTGGCLQPVHGNHAIRLAYRGIQQSSQNWVMVGVIGLGVSDINNILQHMTHPGYLSLVNNKSQVIVSITISELTSFQNYCQKAGALNIIPLPFAYPYHIPELTHTSLVMKTYFTSLRLPPLLIPMVAGSAPEHIPHDSNRVASLVADQLRQTVWWYKTIQCLIDQNIETFVVFDPTATLTRIIRWISRQIRTIGISSINDFKQLQDLS